jgi:hypothetical protein
MEGSPTGWGAEDPRLRRPRAPAGCGSDRKPSCAHCRTGAWVFRGGRPNRLAMLLNRGTAILGLRASPQSAWLRSRCVVGAPAVSFRFPSWWRTIRAAGISWRCSVRTRTGCATCVRVAEASCSGIDVARPCGSKRSIPRPELRSWSATCSSRQEPALTSPWISEPRRGVRADRRGIPVFRVATSSLKAE